MEYLLSHFYLWKNSSTLQIITNYRGDPLNKQRTCCVLAKGSSVIGCDVEKGLPRQNGIETHA